MRAINRFCVCLHLAAICLFAYLGMWFFVGWSLVFGGYSVWWLYMNREKGIQA